MMIASLVLLGVGAVSVLVALSMRKKAASLSSRVNIDLNGGDQGVLAANVSHDVIVGGVRGGGRRGVTVE